VQEVLEEVTHSAAEIFLLVYAARLTIHLYGDNRGGPMGFEDNGQAVVQDTDPLVCTIHDTPGFNQRWRFGFFLLGSLQRYLNSNKPHSQQNALSGHESPDWFWFVFS
jgi:hypothetical protein